MIRLLSRFLTSRLHYSIVSPSPPAMLSFPSQPRDSILACRCQFVFSLAPFTRLLARFQPLPSPLALPCRQPNPQNASPECRGGETLDSQIIESNNGGQFLSVARRSVGRPPSPSAFVILRNPNLLPAEPPTLIVNGGPRTTSTESRIRILERYLRVTSPSIPNNRLPSLFSERFRLRMALT